MNENIVETVAAVIMQLITLGPAVIKGVENAKPFAEVIVNTVLGGNVTDEQRAQIEAQITSLSNQLQDGA